MFLICCHVFSWVKKCHFVDNILICNRLHSIFFIRKFFNSILRMDKTSFFAWILAVFDPYICRVQRKPIWKHEQIAILNWIVHIFFSLALCKTKLIELIKNVCGCITIEGPAENFIEHSGDVHVSSCHEIANMQSIFHLQTCIQSTWQSILVARHFKHKKSEQNKTKTCIIFFAIGKLPIPQFMHRHRTTFEHP